MVASFKLGKNERNLSRIVDLINRIVDGRTLNKGTVTLTASAGSTQVTLQAGQINENSVITLSPRTANAAAALGTTYVSDKANGSFTLTHANNAQTDRTFDYSWTG